MSTHQGGSDKHLQVLGDTLLLCARLTRALFQHQQAINGKQCNGHQSLVPRAPPSGWRDKRGGHILAPDYFVHEPHKRSGVPLEATERDVPPSTQY